MSLSFCVMCLSFVCLVSWVGCGTNGKLFASCVSSFDDSCASLSPSQVFLSLSPWQGVDFVEVVLSPLDDGDSFTVRLFPSSSRDKAWARQLSSCKATQVAAVSFSGCVFKPRQASVAPLLEYFKTRISESS